MIVTPMKRILVIEDQAPMRRNLALLLEMEGFTVLTAADGRTGLELARAEKPDLVVCDVMMPELDGHGVVQSLRADPATAHIPFVFLTARGDKADIRAGMNLGADDYLSKPVIREDFGRGADAADAGAVRAGTCHRGSGQGRISPRLQFGRTAAGSACADPARGGSAAGRRRARATVTLRSSWGWRRKR